MANEIEWSVIKTATGKENVAIELLKAQTDQYYIENHPALIDVADLSGSGADTTNIRDNNLNGAAVMTSIGEAGTYANSAYAANKFPVAIGQYYNQFAIGDMAKAVAPGGELSAAAFAQDAMARRARTITKLLAVQVASITTAHTMTSAPTVDDLMICDNKLELQYAQGPRIVVLKPQQWHSIRLDAAFEQALNNSVMNDPEVMAMAKYLGGVYKGRYGLIDIFVAFEVTTNAAKYQGAMFTRGCILKAKATPVADTPDTVILGDMSFAAQASTTSNETLYRASIMTGVAIGQQAAGIRFESPV